MTSQSELEQFIRKHTFADFAPGGEGSDVVMVDPEVLAAYIAANYTPNDVAKEEYRRGYANGYEAGSKYYRKNLLARKVRYECSICKLKMEELIDDQL